ncbi:MAG TPA: outer membrane protein assembly factor BamD [Vicinamibacterales bacterium]|nr:outer membrane protein assembly factor BamD [Vicinamibacterales bacterium]
MRLVCAALAALMLTACGPKIRVPNVGEADADKFLYDRGTEFLNKKNWINAREYFRRIIDSYPRSPYREEAKLGIGDTFIGEGRIDALILGANEFREFLTYFPRSPRADYAQYRLGYAQFKQMLGAQRDQTATHDAIRELKRFLDAYPDSKYRPEVVKLHRQARDRLSEADFKVGLLYHRIRNYRGAIMRFNEIIKTDPEYTKRDEVFYYLGETLRKIQLYAEALPAYDRVVKEFDAKSKYHPKAQKRIEEVKRSLAAAAAKTPGKSGPRP